MAEHDQRKVLFATSLTESSVNDIEGVGVIRWDGESAYRWVKNLTATDTVVGEIVTHDMSARPNSTLFQAIYAMASDDLGMMAGVCMSIIVDEYYGWIQILGPCTSALVIENQTTITEIGDYCKGVDGEVHATLDAATQPAYTRNIQALEVLTSTQDVTVTMVVQVNCLG